MNASDDFGAAALQAVNALFGGGDTETAAGETSDETTDKDTEETEFTGDTDESTEDEAEGDEPDAATEDDKSEEEEDGDEPDPLAQEFTATVDGVKVTVTAKQLVDSYQAQAASTKRFQEAKRIRQEAEQAVAFATEFSEDWNTDPGHVLATLYEQIDARSRSDVFVKLLETAIAIDPQLAQQMGVDDTEVQRVRLAHQGRVLDRDRKALEKERQANAKPDTWNTPDEKGFTQTQYAEMFAEILDVAEMSNASVDEKRELIKSVLDFADRNNIANPVSAYARFERERAKSTAAKQTITKKAVTKASTKTSAALAPKSKAAQSEGTPVVSSFDDAARVAVAQLLNRS
jgi:hypothetical protein